MQVIKKSIEYFPDDKYGNLPYGTIYYVGGTQTPYTDNLFRENIPVFIERLNQLTDNYLTCNIVYLEPKNDLFKTKHVFAFYRYYPRASTTPKVMLSLWPLFKTAIRKKSKMH